MFVAKLGAVLAAGLLSLTVAQPVYAASAVTDAFLANVRPNIAFLDRSSRMAAERAYAAPMRAFAQDEIDETAKVSEALDVLSLGDRRFAAVAAASTTGLLTGRSVATDVVVKPAGYGQAANARMPMGSDEIVRLHSLSGQAFDEFYWARQLDALSQLRADYTSYIARGDDTALVAVARRELPKVEQRLLALTKL